MTAKTYPNGRCCVFQPFDKGQFDKRFDDTIAPAIEDAGLEPYRVDRDPGATILIDTLHEEIRGATVCFADITSHNPNVMYELGYAIALGKDIVLVSTKDAPKFPFDIQHRQVITYSPESKTDFERLSTEITQKLQAILKRQEKTATITSAAPVKATAGLKSHEFTALALLMASTDAPCDAISSYLFKQEMSKAGYTDVATRIALRRLFDMGLATHDTWRDRDGDPYTAYQITAEGETWLVQNQDGLQLRIQDTFKFAEFETSSLASSENKELTDDDVPF
jgi:nucleoside 2-deoxyribosyltransferase